MNTIIHDPSLPGLATLLEPQLLMKTLHSLNAMPVLSKALITYIKYKPATNCLVGYQFGTDTSLFDGYARALRHDAYASVQGHASQGCIQLDQQALELRFFPYDRRLPRLRVLADAQRKRALLKRLFPEQPEWWHGHLERLAYKPERRYVARLVVGHQPLAVLKFHTPDAYVAARRAATFTQGQANLAPLIGHSERDNVLAYGWLEGRVASAALLDETWLMTGFVQIGAALAALHTLPATGLPVRQPAAELGALNAAADAVASLCPELACRTQALRQTLAMYLNTMPIMPGLIHGDFYARQVLLHGAGTMLIDFDEAAYADQMLDLANMLAHIEYDVLCSGLRRERANMARANLLLGYLRQLYKTAATDLDLMLAKLTMLTAARLLLLAPQPFRSYMPGWPDHIQAIVERCEGIANLSQIGAP